VKVVAREDYPDAWLRQGDVNGDGLVDMVDIATIAKYYRQPASVDPTCDLDGDGWISIFDLERAGGNFGLTYEVWLQRLQERTSSRVAVTVALMLPLTLLGVK
jgi:hypothetical protein